MNSGRLAFVLRKSCRVLLSFMNWTWNCSYVKVGVDHLELMSGINTANKAFIGLLPRRLDTCTTVQVGAAKKELHLTKFRRLNLGMLASAFALLPVRAAQADLETPVADVSTVVQAGLTSVSCMMPSHNLLLVCIGNAKRGLMSIE